MSTEHKSNRRASYYRKTGTSRLMNIVGSHAGSQELFDESKVIEEEEEEDVKEEEPKTCGESMARSWRDFKHLAKHQAKDGRILYFNNEASNWTKICGALWTLYVVVGLIFYGLLQAVLDIGNTVLWVYLVLFLFFVFIMVAMIITGQVERIKQEKEEMIAEAKAQEELAARMAAAKLVRQGSGSVASQK